MPTYPRPKTLIAIPVSTKGQPCYNCEDKPKTETPKPTTLAETFQS